MIVQAPQFRSPIPLTTLTPIFRVLKRDGRKKLSHSPDRVGLVVGVSASHTVGRGFASRLGHTIDHHKNGTNYLPAWARNA